MKSKDLKGKIKIRMISLTFYSESSILNGNRIQISTINAIIKLVSTKKKKKVMILT